MCALKGYDGVYMICVPYSCIISFLFTSCWLCALEMNLKANMSVNQLKILTVFSTEVEIPYIALEIVLKS